MSYKPTGLLREHGSLVFLLLVLSASLALNVGLGIRVKRLIAMQSRYVLAQPLAGLKPNTNLAQLPVLDGQGHHIKLSLNPRKPTILYVIAPGCPWCAKNVGNIRTLVEKRSAEFEFVAVSNRAAGLHEDATASMLRFPIYVLDEDRLPSDTRQEMVKGFGPTPQTVVVRPDGTIERSWTGAIQNTKPEVEKYFGISLPGLPES